MRNPDIPRLALVIAATSLVAATPYIFGFIVDYAGLNTSEIAMDRTLGIYADPACTQTVTTIDWGDQSPGAKATRTLYLKNLGEQNVTLALGTDDWVPNATREYLSLSGHCAQCGDSLTGHTLRTNGVLTVEFSLHVSPESPARTDFSFTIIIIGTPKE